MRDEVQETHGVMLEVSAGHVAVSGFYYKSAEAFGRLCTVTSST